MCTLVSNLRAQKNWFAIQRREWGRGESGRIWIQFPKTASLNVDRQLLGFGIKKIFSDQPRTLDFFCHNPINSQLLTLKVG